MSTKGDCKERSPLQEIRLPQNCRCPCCGNSKLLVVEKIINQPMSTEPSGGVMIISETLSVVPVICGSCGCVQYFSLEVLKRNGLCS